MLENGSDILVPTTDDYELNITIVRYCTVLSLCRIFESNGSVQRDPRVINIPKVMSLYWCALQKLFSD